MHPVAITPHAGDMVALALAFAGFALVVGLVIGALVAYRFGK